MAKYSFEFKKKVVLEYINGEGGTQYLSTKYVIIIVGVGADVVDYKLSGGYWTYQDYE